MNASRQGVPKPPGQGTSRNARRNRNRRTAAAQPTQNYSRQAQQPVAPVQAQGNAQARKNRPRSNVPSERPAAVVGGPVFSGRIGTAPVVVSGQDLIETDTFTGTAKDGDTLLTVVVSPASFVGTHLNKVATSFESYRFVKLEFDVIPRVPSVINGGYFAGFTPDVHQVVSAGKYAKRVVRSWDCSAGASFTDSTALTIPLSGTGWKSMDYRDDPYSNAIGLMAVVLDTPSFPAGDTSRVCSISMQMRWTIELQHSTISVADGPTLLKMPASVPIKYFGDKAIYVKTDGIDGNWTSLYQNMYRGQIWALEPAWSAKAVNAKSYTLCAKYCVLSNATATTSDWFLTFYNSIMDARAAGADPSHTNGLAVSFKTSTTATAGTTFVYADSVPFSGLEEDELQAFLQFQADPANRDKDDDESSVSSSEAGVAKAKTKKSWTRFLKRKKEQPSNSRTD